MFSGRSYAWGIIASLMATALGSAQPATPSRVSRVTGGKVTHEIVAGDTLFALASRYGVDIPTLAAQNHLLVSTPLRVGFRLTIDTRHIVPASTGAAIVVNVAQRHLFWFQPDGGVVSYPVAVGRPSWKTLLGTFTVVQKRVDPVWNVPPSIREEMRAAGRLPVDVVPPGPDNPLGDRWLGLSFGGIGIHGTNAPTSIYQFTTHGCIRVSPENLRTLFDGVALGTPGAIVYEPVLVAVVGDRILVEVHRDPYGWLADPAARLWELLRTEGADRGVDPLKVGDALLRRQGVVVDVTRAPQ